MANSPLAEMRLWVRMVLWAALIGAGAWLAIPLPGVPFSLQVLFVVLLGLSEKPKFAAAAVGFYLLAGLLGLPVFTGGVAGPAVLFRPSAGFALAFPLGAALASFLVHRDQKVPPGFKRLLFAAVAALIPIYGFGFLGLLVNTDLPLQTAGGIVLTFLPADLLKCVIAAALVLARQRRQSS